jgi:zinc D-Ala-D-Ala dipeptidase
MNCGSDNAMKLEFILTWKNPILLKEDDVAAPSNHSRGGTMDLTIVALARSEIDVYLPGEPPEARDQPASRRFRDHLLRFPREVVHGALTG